MFLCFRDDVISFKIENLKVINTILLELNNRFELILQL